MRTMTQRGRFRDQLQVLHKSDTVRYFLGGTVLNRVSLALVNGVVIGGFGGHCVRTNRLAAHE